MELYSSPLVTGCYPGQACAGTASPSPGRCVLEHSGAARDQARSDGAGQGMMHL